MASPAAVTGAAGAKYGIGDGLGEKRVEEVMEEVEAEERNVIIVARVWKTAAVADEMALNVTPTPTQITSRVEEAILKILIKQ